MILRPLLGVIGRREIGANIRGEKGDLSRGSEN